MKAGMKVIHWDTYIASYVLEMHSTPLDGLDTESRGCAGPKSSTSDDRHGGKG